MTVTPRADRAFAEISGYILVAGAADLYVRQYVPAVAEGVPVLLVGPDGEERTWSQRVLVNLARHLAGLGHPVVRFDFRGQGESGGTYEEMDARSRVDDVASVMEWMRGSSGVEPVVAGFRLGANVAARYLRTCGRDTGPFIAVEPIHPVGPVIDELLRKNVAHQYLVHKKLLHTRQQLLQQIRDGGTVNCSGFILGPALASSIGDLAWDAEPPLARSVVLRITERGEPAGELVPGITPFWKDGPTFKPFPLPLFERIAAIVAESNAARASATRVLGPLAAHGADGREIVSLETAAGICVGTFHPAASNGDAAPHGDMAALILNPGPNDRSSPHGLNVRIAEFFRSRGVAALRIEGRAIGESEGDDSARQDKATPLVHREINAGDHAAAARAALAWLRTHGARRVIVTGLCGGAVNGLIASASERDLQLRLVLMGTPVLHLGTPEEWEFPDEAMRDEFSRMSNKFLRPAAILRALTFRSDYKVAWKILKARVDQVMRKKDGTAAKVQRHPNMIVPMVDSCEALARRGARVTFVFSSFDVLHGMFLKHFPPLAEKNQLPAGSDIFVIDGANHNIGDRSAEAVLLRVYDDAIAEMTGGAVRPASPAALAEAGAENGVTVVATARGDVSP